MIRRCRRATLAALVALWQAGCALLPDSSAPEKSELLLPAVPLGCLADPQCDFTASGPVVGEAYRSVSLESTARGDASLSSGDLVKSLRPGTDIRFDDVAREIEAAFGAGLERARAALTPGSADKTAEDAKIDGPPMLDPRPPAFMERMQEYAGGESYLRCAASLFAIEHARHHPVAERARQHRILVALYTRYTFLCLEDGNAELLDRLVLFTTTWPEGAAWGVFCLGFDVDGRHVVTAKHCLVDPGSLQAARAAKGADDPVAWMRASKLPASKLAYAARPGERLDYRLSKADAQARRFFNPFVPQDDVAVVELVTPRPRPPFPVGQAREFDFVHVHTAFLDADTAAACGSGTDAARCRPARLIRQDAAPTCAIYKIQQQCVLHACQSRPGASGGPVIANRDGRLVLVGVHNGSIDDKRAAPCGLPRGDIFPNYGIGGEAFLARLKASGIAVGR